MISGGEPRALRIINMNLDTILFLSNKEKH